MRNMKISALLLFITPFFWVNAHSAKDIEPVAITIFPKHLSQLKATRFPLAVKNGIHLHYNGSKDVLFDLPTIIIQVFNGTLIPSNPFPGLYVYNKNKTYIEATGPIEDLQLWIESGRNSSDYYNNKSDEYVEPGGGIRYLPPIYDWIGKAVIQLKLLHPKVKDKDRLPTAIALAKVEIDVDPYLEMKINIESTVSRSSTMEDESFYPFRSEPDRIVVTFESVARWKVINCILKSSSGNFDVPKINGTIANLKKTLTEIKYIPQVNFNGRVNATVKCHDIVAKQNDEAKFEIQVLPVNDPPIITTHPSKIFEVWEDTDAQLGIYASLFILDDDVRESNEALIAVDLSVSAGKAQLQLPPPEKLGSVFISSKSSSHIRLLGHIDQINFLLQFILLSFHQDWHGKGTLSIQCTDDIELGNQPMEIIFGNWVFNSFDFIVKSVNDDPFILINHTYFENISEDEVIYFKGKAVTIIDIDSQSTDLFNFTININAVNGVIPGRIEFDDLPYDNVFQGTQISGNSSFFFVRSNLITVQQYLELMRFVVLEDWAGVCYNCISILVTDIHNGKAREHLTFNVKSLNDPPFLQISATEFTSDEDQEISLSDFINITVFDPDILYSSNQGILFEVTISSPNNGLVGLKDHVPGCHIIKGRPYLSLESSLSFKGQLDKIATALNLLYYRPPLDLDAYDILTFTVVDESYLHDKVDLRINLNGFQDPPSVFMNRIMKTLDIEGLPLLKTNVTIADPDSLDREITLTLSLDPINAGTIYCPRLAKSGINTKVNKTGQLSLYGEIESINFVVDEVIITLNDGFTEHKATLAAEVKDQEGMANRAYTDIFTEMNQKVPSFVIIQSSSSVTILEDTPLHIHSLIELKGDFEDSSIFELKLEYKNNYTNEESLLFRGRFKFDDLSLPGIHIPTYDSTRGSLGDIIFRGNVKALQYALKKLYVTPPPHFFGVFTLNFGIRARRSDSFYADTYIVDEVLIRVKSSDDAPVILWDGMSFIDKNPVLDVDEDSYRSFGSRLIVKDIDDNGGTLSAEISSSFGNLCYLLEGHDFFENVAFTFFDSDKVKKYACIEGNYLKILLKLSELNDFLRTCVYKPDTNWWGIDEIKLHILSNENSVEMSIRVAVRPVQDDIFIHAPSEVLTVSEDDSLLIHKLFVTDDDINPPESPQSNICVRLPQQCSVTVRIKVHHGTLIVKSRDAFLFYQHNNKMLVLSGSIESINESLSSLIYQPEFNYVGDDWLDISSESAQGSYASKRVQIEVTEVNDGPILVLPSPAGQPVFTLLEDSTGIIGDNHCHDSQKPSSFITCQKIQIQDVDGHLEGDRRMKLSLFSHNGSFNIARLRMVRNISVTQANFSTQDFSNSVEMLGSLKYLNLALVGLFFKGNLNYNTFNSFEELQIRVEDMFGKSASGSLLLKILPVNDNPVIVIEGDINNHNVSTSDGLGFKRIRSKILYINEDESIHVKGISIRDVDCNNMTEILEMTISASNGNLLLGDHVAIRHWVEGAPGTYFQNITVRGTINNLNHALKYMVYKPNQNYNGEDFVRVQVSDMGNIGVMTKENTLKSKALFDTADIPLTILPIEDDPILVSPNFLQLDEDSAVIIDMKISHPDSNYMTVQISFKCSNGKLMFIHNEGLTFINNTYNDSADITVVASVSSLQRSLNQVMFLPNENWNNHNMKPDEIIISVSNFIPNQRCQHATVHVIKVEIAEINDPPLWHIPGSVSKLQPIGGYVIDFIPTFHVLEDSTLEIYPISIHDVDAINTESELLFKVTISTENGSIQLAKYHGLFEENSSSSHIDFSATYHYVNEALNHLTYSPLPNFNGRDNITLQLIDGEFNKTITIPILVEAVPDFPRINIPLTLSCNRDQLCQISNVTIHDVDMHSELHLNISTRMGSLLFFRDDSNSLRAIKVLEGNLKGDISFLLSGTASDLSNLLQQLAYLPLFGSSQSIYILHMTVSVPIEVPQTKEKLDSSITTFIVFTNSNKNHAYIRYDKAIYHDDPQCPFSYRPINNEDRYNDLQAFCNDVPILPPFVCFEDFDCSLQGLTLHDADSKHIQLNLNVELGTIKLNNNTGIHLLENKTGHYLNLRGNTHYINSALLSLTYRSSSNFVGKDSIHIKVLDEEYLSNDETINFFELIIDIVVNGVEDNISFFGSNYLLHTQKEDELSILPSISVSHSHSVSSNNIVTLAADIFVTGGNIKFLNMDGINFTIPITATESNSDWKLYEDNDNLFHGSTSNNTRLISKMSGLKDHHWWKSVSMCGLIGSINNLLKNITFIGDKDTNTDVDNPAEINIAMRRVKSCKEAIHPLTNNAIGALSNRQNYDDALSMLIHIDAVNDAPVISAGEQTSDGVFRNLELIIADEDSRAYIPAHVEDVDDDIVQVEISTCLAGYIYVKNDTPGLNNDLYFLNGSSDDYYHHLIMKGTIYSINNYLVNLHFMGHDNYNGDDCVIDLTVCDEHESCNSRQIQIIINPIEDPLSLYIPVDSYLLPPSISIKQGQEILIGAAWMNDQEFMLMKVPSHHQLQNKRKGVDSDNTKVELHPLIIGTPFLILDDSNDTNNTKPNNEKVACLLLETHKGKIYLKEPWLHDKNLKLLYRNDNSRSLSSNNTSKDSKQIIIVGPIESMNDISKNLMYGSIESETGNTQIKIKVSQALNCKEIKPKTYESCECDFDVYDAQGSLHIFVKSMNSGPQIKWVRNNQGDIDEEQVQQKRLGNIIIRGKNHERIPLHGLQIVDSDMNDMQTIDSHGRVHYGFVTVSLSILKNMDKVYIGEGVGTLSFRQTVDGVTSVLGVDEVDTEMLQIMGSLDKVNLALQYLEYQCQDCQVGTKVQIHVGVEDNGFTGSDDQGNKQGQLQLDIFVIE